MSWIHRYLRWSLTRKIIIGFVLGIALGIAIGPKVAVISIFGDVFLKLLKMIVMPIVLFTIAAGSASIRPSQMGRLGAKILGFYVLTSSVAISIGLGIANLFPIGKGLRLDLPHGFNPNVQPPGLRQIILSIIPDNPFAALIGKNPLPVIFVAMLLGIAVAILRDSDDERLKKHAEQFFGLLRVLSEVLFEVTRWILELAPVGVLALTATVIGRHGSAVMGPFVGLVIAAHAGMLIHFFVVLGALLLLGRLNPLRFWLGAKDAILAGYSSRSSSAIIPVTLQTLEKQLGVSRTVSSFTIPLGATINMDGTAMYLAMETVFAARVFGVPLSFDQQLTILVVALLASIGTAGVPSASLVMLVGVLRAVNLPTSIIPMFAGFDPFVDMMRTATNIAGDMTGTVLIAKSENALDTSVGTWRQRGEALAGESSKPTSVENTGDSHAP